MFCQYFCQLLRVQIFFAPSRQPGLQTRPSALSGCARIHATYNARLLTNLGFQGAAEATIVLIRSCLQSVLSAAPNYGISFTDEVDQDLYRLCAVQLIVASLYRLAPEQSSPLVIQSEIT
jgi:hypothetical protein